MPIYIDLKKFNTETVKNCLKTVLDKTYYFDTEKLKKQQLIILMDGYDEISGGSKDNLYARQELEKWPNVKVVISCRTQALSPDYERWFMPTKNKKLTTEGFKDCTLLPFTTKQIDSYLQRYVEQSERPYNLEEYRKYIGSIPNLGELISNPFILRLLTEALPEFLRHAEKGLSINRYAIYEAFMRYWFIKQEKRLTQNIGLKENRDYLKSFEDFSKEIALKLYTHNQIEIKTEDSFWESYFSDINADTVKVRSGCPLQRTDVNCYAFVHKSFLEYFVAKAIVEAVQQARDTVKPEDITKQQAVIDFLKDIIELTPEIKKVFFSYIEASKGKELFAKAAANAITLLNAVKESFSLMNFEGIRIPGANLNSVTAHRTNFNDADLSGCNFNQAYLAESSFNKANLHNAKFGEMRYLSWPTGCVASICFTPDGKKLIAAGDSNTIIIYDFGTGNIIRSLIKHPDRVTSIEIDHQGKFLISRSSTGANSSMANPISYLWNIETGKASVIPNDGNCATFVPNSSKIAYIKNKNLYYATIRDLHEEYSQIFYSGSHYDLSGLNIVTDNKTIIPINNRWVDKIKYSGDGKFLAVSMRGNNFMASNGSIRIWDMQNEKELEPFKDKLENEYIDGFNFCFSSNSKKIAVASTDEVGNNIIKIYKLPDLILEYKLEKTHAAGGVNTAMLRHGKTIEDLKFLPNNDNIFVSCGSDGNIFFWDLLKSQEEPVANLTAHKCPTTCLTFSPNGEFLVSGSGNFGLSGPSSGDLTLRVWDFKNILSLQQSIPVNYGSIETLTISKANRTIFTGGNDGFIRCWSLENGEYLNKTPAWENNGKPQNKRMLFRDIGDKGIGGLCLINKENFGNAEYLISLSKNGGIKFFKINFRFLEEEKTISLAFSDIENIRTIAKSSDNQRIAVSGFNGSLNILDLNILKPIFSSNNIASHVTSLAFSLDPKSKFLAMAGHNLLTVIDSYTGELIYKPEELEEETNVYYGAGTIAFSPIDHNILASYRYVSSGNMIQPEFSNQLIEKNTFTQIALWDIASKKKIREFYGHQDCGSQLCFSPNGKYLLSGSCDGEVVILDVEKQIEISRFMAGEMGNRGIGINNIQFINNNMFVISQYNGSIKTWSLFNHLDSSYSVNLRWHVPSELVLRKATFENVKNLKHQDQLLLNQKGATVAEKPTLLINKIIYGKSLEAIMLIEKSMPLDLLETDDIGRNALHWAVEKNDLKVIRALTEKSIKLVKSKDNNSVTPLILALNKGKDSSAALKLMIESFSEGEQFKDQLDALFKQGADCYLWFNEYVTNSIKLMQHIGTEHECNLKLIGSLVQSGASVKFREMHYGCTPLIIAAGAGQLELVRWLLKNGSSINETNQFGAMAIHAAAQKGQLELVKYFLQNNLVDFSVKNGDGYNTLDIALLCHQPLVANWLINYAKGRDCLENSRKSQAAFLLKIIDDLIKRQIGEREDFDDEDADDFDEYEYEEDYPYLSEQINPILFAMVEKAGLEKEACYEALVMSSLEVKSVRFNILCQLDQHMRAQSGLNSPINLLQNPSKPLIFSKNMNIQENLESSVGNKQSPKKIESFNEPAFKFEKKEFLNIFKDVVSKKANCGLLIEKYELKNNSQEELDRGLRKAAFNNQIDDLDLFIEIGVNINARDLKQGKTALHLAVSKGFLDCVAKLLKNNADPSVQDFEGKAPATYTNDDKILKLLNSKIEEKKERENFIQESQSIEPKFNSSFKRIGEELLKIKQLTHCFDSYSNLNEKIQLMIISKISQGKAQIEWDKNDDMGRYELLKSLGLGKESYSFLNLEFRQELSSGTQLQRHALKGKNGIHPSTEDFWNANPNLHSYWINEMAKPEKERKIGVPNIKLQQSESIPKEQPEKKKCTIF